MYAWKTDTLKARIFHDKFLQPMSSTDYKYILFCVLVVLKVIRFIWVLLVIEVRTFEFLHRILYNFLIDFLVFDSYEGFYSCLISSDKSSFVVNKILDFGFNDEVK